MRWRETRRPRSSWIRSRREATASLKSRTFFFIITTSPSIFIVFFFFISCSIVFFFFVLGLTQRISAMSVWIMAIYIAEFSLSEDEEKGENLCLVNEERRCVIIECSFSSPMPYVTQIISQIWWMINFAFILDLNRSNFHFFSILTLFK